ncbi:MULTISPECIES: LysR family transcriptional regulator [Pseudomonas]|uniref:LysR family transcriptional regulator n=1 Tax=Pseudomonas weihenstephanensis TaxID=1608994 RepID=A0A0J6M1Y6_9PSED|nr:MULTISPECIES: LysR family transcriptional regulator [Pseudomonas]GLX90541.1 transcriptional regulator [Pseudomonas fragi]KMN12618.1 LysR family transcriptional regulator [Pseudomonas weihenstephanensis]KMN20571.1 LysR family transcriptional regulator [Pseudomonas weihenstephanensis]KVV05668.1 HTH-type transcriptional regulator YofA [Pseudomonas sp. TAD18]KVV07177.1 HTH-type transcriptional regulator YofA [Pseudomonas sp. TAA207]
MDLDLARTFLEIVRYGSLASAAQNLHVTQTAVTARVQKLESLLGVTLFIRNRAGARLTPEGEAFVVYANQLLQTWEAARRDLPRPEGLNQVLHIAGEVSLCNPLILSWTKALRQHLTSHAVRVQIRDGEQLLRQVEMGLLDAALVYRPAYWPGVQVEQLLEEKLIQIRRPALPEPYVYVDWGEDFRRQHDAALPDKARAALSFNLGPVALHYILENGGSGYFRTRVVQSYLNSGALERVPKAPEFSYPTYLVYSRERDCAALQQALELLRDIVKQDSDWSQRWGPEV